MTRRKEREMPMIRYKCVHCGVELETDDPLSGKQEPCPDCGKANVVPLSKQDLAKQKAQQKEKLQQEQDGRLREEEAKHRKHLDLAAAMGKEQAAEEQGQLAKKQLGMSMTEEALGTIAGIYITLGVIAAVILIGIASQYEQYLYLLGALMVLATSVLWAVLIFAAQWGLQYLRRITNVLEGGE
jgi:DNA-directed RNA polymerase subunit RPC12/RpoP